MHFEEAKTKFLQELSNKGKLANTLKNYKNDLRVFQTFLEKGAEYKPQTTYREVGTHRAHDFIDHLSLLYPANNSRRRRLQVVRMFYDFLVKENIVQNNPIKTVPSFPRILNAPKPPPYKEIIKLWTHLVKKVDDNETPVEGKKEDPIEEVMNLRNLLIFILIYGSGLTVAHLNKLTRKNIQLGKTPRVTVTPEKRDPYTIPLHKVFGKYQQRYFQKLSQLGLSHLPYLLLSGNNYTFFERPISTRGIELLFENYRKELKISITPKGLRQAAVIRWFNGGESIEIIRSWMGVAPNHDLKEYQEMSEQVVYQDHFLG